MNLLGMIATDIREGWVSLRWWYLVTACLFAVDVGAMALQAKAYGYADMHFSVGDYLCYFFAGAKEFSLLYDEPFRFPPAWAATVLVPLYMTLWYPCRDLSGFGTLMMVEGGGRWKWWLAKALWVAITIVLFFAVALIVAVFAAIVLGGSLSLSVSDGTPLLMGSRPSQIADPPYDIVSMLAVCVVAMIALALFQLTVSVIVDPLVAYVAIVATLFLSVFYKNDLLVGNYLMAIRNASFMKGGMDAGTGFVASCVLALSSIAIGGWLLSKKDLLGKENLS